VAPRIGSGGYHIFLSHVWGSGQDQMRVVKQRLLEMIPDLSVFLDVDDLDDIANLDKYIARAQVVLIFCTDGYFRSKNCIIEIQAAVKMGKRIIALLDPDASKGGLTRDQVHEQLIEAETHLYAKWRLDEGGPSAKELNTALFACQPIEWNRIGVFQDVTLRCIAERLLPEGHKRTYLQREIVNEEIVIPPATKSFHIYCSQNNPGALELVREFAGTQGLTLVFAPSIRRSSSSVDGRKSRDVRNTALHVAQDVDQLRECDAMLVYLTARTWTRAQASNEFGLEVGMAMDETVRLLLTHEMNGVGGQEARYGCEFASFFSCDDGATPTALLQRGIYAKIAVALKGAQWRKTSMVMLAKAFAGSDAVGREDARELKRAQAMSRAVQQELGMQVATGTAASTAAEAAGSTVANSFSLLSLFSLLLSKMTSPGGQRGSREMSVELQSSVGDPVGADPVELQSSV